MSVVVIDASVGVKWFVPEVHSAEARQWRNGPKPNAPFMIACTSRWQYNLLGGW